MTPSRRKWMKRIAAAGLILVLLAIIVPRAGIPFIGPRSRDLREAGIWWYRSYNGSNWLDESRFYKFTASPARFAEAKRALHLKPENDPRMAKYELERMSRSNLFWFRAPWDDGMELYKGYHETLIRDPETGLCLMVVRN